MRRMLLLSVAASSLVSMLLTALVMTLALPAVVDAQATRIQAEQLTVVGDNGAERITLRTGPGIAAALQVLDASGNRRVQLATGLGPQSTGDRPIGAGVNVYDARGEIAGRLGTNEDGSQLVLNDANGRPRVRMLVADDGTPSIQMLDANGTVTWNAR